MIKKYKTILYLMVVFVIILAVVFYALIPEYKVSNNRTEKIITIQDLVQDTYIDSLKIASDPLRLIGKLSIDNEDLRNIIYTLKEKHKFEELKEVSFNIKNSKINILDPYKFMKFINSQYSVDLSPSIVDGDIVILFDNLKIGKINLPNKMLVSILSNLKDEVPFIIIDNVLTVDKSFIKPLTLNKINLKEDKLILDIELHFKNIIDFIKEYNIKVS